MNLGDLAFRLVLLLFPGIFATLLYKKLIIRKKWDSIDIGLYTLLFGIISYLLLQLVFLLLGQGELSIWRRLQDDEALPYSEILFSTLMAVFVGLFAVFVHNKSLINKFANRLAISDKYSDNNLIYSFFEKSEIQQININLPDLNLIYCGYLYLFSEDENIKEIVLKDVIVYEYETAEQRHEEKYVYLNFSKTDNLIITIPEK